MQRQPAAAAATPPNPAWNECPGQSELQCPHCLAMFSERDTTEYLIHCNECANLRTEQPTLKEMAISWRRQQH